MKIKISKLTFKCIIGLLDFERITKQKVIINISFEYEFKENNFIDYAQVSNLIKKIMKKKKFELLETAITHLEQKLNNLYNIHNLKIKITKPDILKDCIVSLSN